MAGPTTPTSRKNPTDKGQEDIETAEFEGGIAVFSDGKTRNEVKADGAAERNVAGVVVPASDRVGEFAEDDIGKGGPAAGPLVLVKNNEEISFVNIIGDDGINSGTGTEFSVLSPGDQILVSGSVSNDGIHTISTVELSGARVVTTGSVTLESAGASITITKV